MAAGNLRYGSAHFGESRWVLAFDLGVIASKPSTTLSAPNDATVAGTVRH